MFASIRAFAKSWVAAVLIGLLIVSFAVFGINDIFRGTPRDSVISVGGRNITSAEFKREFDAFKGRLEQQMGQPITLEMASENGLDRRIVDGLATRTAFSEMTKKMGIRVSPELVRREFQKIPAFFDPVSGRFDKRQFEKVVSENGMTPDQVVEDLGSQLAERHLDGGLVSGVRMPRAYAAMAAIYMTEARDISLFTVQPSMVPPPAPPTDAQLVAFMRENAAQLTRPEFRVLSVVRFSPEQVSAGVAIDPAELQKRYDFRKDTLSTPETRTLVQIPAKDQATAQVIVQRLTGGETPAAVAKAVGAEPILYENKPQSAVADRKVGAAAFRMPVDQVAAVQGDLGVAVVKILGVTAGKQVSLAEARPALEAELRRDAALEKIYALTQAYDEAHQAGASLAEAAQKAGVPSMTVGPVAKQGMDAQGRPVPGLNPRIMDTAFELPAGGESELVEAGNGEYYAVRVERIMPAALPPLAEVKPQLSRVWTLREIGKRMDAKAEELAARVRKGETLEAVAASAGAPVSRLASLDRASAARAGAELGQETLAAVFNAKPGEVFTAHNARSGVIVGKLQAIRAGQGPMLARMAEDARSQMNNQLFGEIQQASRLAARQEMKVKIDYNRARAAIGLEPVEPPAAKGKAAAGKLAK